MSIIDILTISGGIITVLGAVVALTLFFAKLYNKLEKDKLSFEVKDWKDKYENVNKDFNKLLNAGSIVFHKKLEIEKILSSMSRLVRAKSNSILIPAPSMIPNDEIAELVFLCINGPGSEKIKNTRVPLTSIAGKTFLEKKVIIKKNPGFNNSFSGKTDKIVDMITESLIAIPLIYDGRCIGVLEFLNRDDNGTFKTNDYSNIQKLINPLTEKLNSFLEEPSFDQCIEVSTRKPPQEGTILFGDLTNYSLLLNALDSANIIDLVNEYFEEMCQIGLEFGATIDKYIGDGYMLSFNVGKELADHELNSVLAAIKMQATFEKLKEKWLTLQIPEIKSVFNRIGIASGKFYRIEMGHSQFKQMTIMGTSVNKASALVESGVRSKNIILISDSVRQKIGNKFKLEKDESKILIAKNYSDSKVYEVLGPK